MMDRAAYDRATYSAHALDALNDPQRRRLASTLRMLREDISDLARSNRLAETPASVRSAIEELARRASELDEDLNAPFDTDRRAA